MGLFDPIWMTKKQDKERKACDEVRKITDQNLLRDIAIKAHHDRRQKRHEQLCPRLPAGVRAESER